MFSKNFVSDQLGLTVNYYSQNWIVPLAVPSLIEFIDNQTTLFYGILYIAPNEQALVKLFERDNLTIHKDIIIMIAEASAQMPSFNIQWKEHRITVFGLAESAARIYNRCVSSGTTPYDQGKPAPFSSVWREIISTPSISEAEISRKLKMYPELCGRLFCVAVVTFHKTGVSIPYRRLEKSFRDLVPNCCIVTENKEIIMLISTDSVDFSITLDRKQLSDLIEPYDGYIAISNRSSLPQNIRQLFFLTERTANVVYKMKLTTDRVYDVGDYHAYLTVDLAAYAFQQLFLDNTHSVLMVHPAVAKLFAYDQNHGDNLFETLYQYLVNDRNVATAAGALFLHRNTVLHKIKKITSMLNVDLDKKELRESLLISCQMMKYIDKYSDTVMWINKEI